MPGAQESSTSIELVNQTNIMLENMIQLVNDYIMNDILMNDMIMDETLTG